MVNRTQTKMKLKDLEYTVRIIAPIGSLISLITQEYIPNREGSERALKLSLEKARSKLKDAKYHLEYEISSDMGYWSQRGIVTSWTVAVNLLTSASLVGSNNLPNVPPPDLSEKCVMDAQHAIEKWSYQLLVETPGFEDFYICKTCRGKWPNEDKHICDGCEGEFCDEHRPIIGFYSNHFKKFGFWCDDCYDLAGDEDIWLEKLKGKYKMNSKTSVRIKSSHRTERR